MVKFLRAVGYKFRMQEKCQETL